MWRARLGGAAASAPVVAADGGLYVGDREGGVWLLDAATGAVLHRRRTPAIAEASPTWALVQAGLVAPDRVPVSAAPAISEWHLFVGDDEGTFSCLRRGDADALWRKAAPLDLAARQGWTYRAPFVADGAVVTVDAGGSLHVADGRHGTTRFALFLRDRPAAAPALQGERRVCVALAPRRAGETAQVVTVDLATGERGWHRELPGAPGPALAATRAHVLVGGDFGLLALAAADGATAWHAAGGVVTGGLAVAGAEPEGGTVVAVTAGGLAAFDLATGALRWRGAGRRGAPPLAGTSPCVAGDVVWTAAAGAVVAWSLDDGEALGRARHAGVAVDGPVVAGADPGLLFVATDRGEVLAFRRAP